MRNPFKKKIVWIDPLELAQRAADEALAVFHKAKDDLKTANEHLGTVKSAAGDAIRAAEGRLRDATEKQNKNTATIQKLEELTG